MAYIDTKGRKKPLVRWREDGKKRSKSAPTLKEARILRADVEKRLLRGEMATAADRKQPFGVYAENLIRSDGKLRKTTREDRLKALRLYVEPRIGHVAMEDLQPARLRAVLASINDEKGPHVTQAAHRVISRVVRQAVVDGIYHANPLEGYRAPDPGRREIRILNPQEVDAVARVMHPRLTILVLLSAWGGFRSGELGGLKPEDFNREAGTLAVRRTMTHPSTGPEPGPPKTESSRRVVTLPRWLVQDLREYLVEFPPGEYLFSMPQGARVTAKNLGPLWRRAAEQVGLKPRPRFHDLRHTAVSILIQQGAHPKMIQARVGHSSITETMDTYGHLFPSADAELAAALEQFKPEEGKVIEL